MNWENAWRAMESCRAHVRELRFELAVLRDSRLNPAEEAARLEAQMGHER